MTLFAPRFSIVDASWRDGLYAEILPGEGQRLRLVLSQDLKHDSAIALIGARQKAQYGPTGNRAAPHKQALTRATDEAEQVMYAALRRGLNFKITLSNVLTLTPALTVSPEELDRALAILDEAIGEVEGLRIP